MSIIIKNGTVITQNEKREIVKYDILLNDLGVVEQIGKNLKEREAEIIDASNCIVMPGLVNTHTHVAMTLFRGYGDGLVLDKWLRERIWPAEAKLTNDVVEAGAILGMIEMLKSGTVALNEMYLKGMNNMMNAAELLNIRMVIAQGMFDTGNRKLDDELKSGKKIIDLATEHSELIQPAISCHAPYTASDELIIKGKELAKKNNILFHIHVSETRKEIFDSLKQKKKRPIEHLNDLNVLNEKTVLAHASWVTKREIKYVGKKGAVISHNPVSNLKLATGGIAPIKEYDTAGANVTLGTDGAASNNTLNMFETMKFASLLQKHKYWDANAIPAQRILDYATINGSKALNVPGSIKVGKKADIIIIKKTPNMLPEHNIVSNIVYASNPAHVEWVIVNGKVSLENGKVPKEKELLEKVVGKINEFF